jgi:alpha-L-fucosidase 2
VVKGATEAIVLVSIATSFNGFDKDPVKQGKDYHWELQHLNLKKAAGPNLSKNLKKAHIADYQQFYNRVELNLGATTAPNLPTDERLKRYGEGKEDKNLEILYFQYRKISADCQLAHSRRSGQFAGIVEPVHTPAVEQQLHHQHQR